MKETVDQMIAHARGVWRYRWAAMGVAWVIVLLGWIGVFLTVSPYYTARAQIYVDTETVLRPLLKGLALEVDHNEQLGLMTRKLLSRPNLEQVLEQVGSDHQGQSFQPSGIVLDKLRSNISLESEKPSKEAKYSNVYTISYSNVNPGLAKQVVESLITAFTENTRAEIQRDAERANVFIAKQIQEYQEQLTAAENNLREFKRKHVAVLPERGGSFFERLQAATSTVRDVDLQIEEAQTRRSELQRQLEMTPAVQRAASTDGTPVLTLVETRLFDMQKKLDELLLRFTEAHPDVIEARASIAELERQKQIELRSGAPRSAVASNPVYQQLELALGEIERELAGLQTKRQAYQNRVQELQQQVATLPVVEDELGRLNRHHEITKNNYQNLLSRKQSMDISKNVEQSTEGEKFRVIDPPNVAVESTRSAIRRQQLLLTTGVLVAGLGGGLGLAFLLSQFRPAVYSQRALSELTGLPVFGVIPRVSTRSTHLRGILGLLGFAVVGVTMLLAYGVTLFIQLSSPDIVDKSMLAGILSSLGGGGR